LNECRLGEAAPKAVIGIRSHFLHQVGPTHYPNVEPDPNQIKYQNQHLSREKKYHHHQNHVQNFNHNLQIFPVKGLSGNSGDEKAGKV
jgi:hypothetical protein